MEKTIAFNKKAKFEYFIEDEFEAGIVLLGSEVKSLRAGKVNISDSFVGVIKGELFILNAHIGKYEKATIKNHDEKRYRKLLLHKNELNKILGKIKRSGYTAVVLKIYFNNNNRVKALIALAKGKKEKDKRQTIKEREWQREKGRILKNTN